MMEGLHSKLSLAAAPELLLLSDKAFGMHGKVKMVIYYYLN